MPAARHCVVPLTAVTQPWMEMADTAVRFLLERMQLNDQSELRKVVFHGEIIERESVLRV
jgi:DNA-binding LacI/PurR family transcriptional regulator